VHRTFSWLGLALFFLALAGFAFTLLDYVADTNLFPAGVQQHVSNFALSGLFCLCAGLLVTAVGAPYRSHLIAPAVAILSNYLVETLMTGDNVRDLTDFAAGTAGAVLGYLFGILIAAVGVRAPT
jgi:hypothetical protein